MFFDVIISNSVCECIFGRQSVTYHFGVTVTLSSDLVFRIIMSGAYLLYYAVVIPNSECGCILGSRSVPSYFRVTLTLTSDPFSRISIEFWGICTIFFEVEISKFVYVCILVWRYVVYHF